MNIPTNLTNLGDQFKVAPKYIPSIDETLFLINPIDVMTDWTPGNLVYRSSVWNSSGRLVSAGFKKFFNWGEKPHLSPTPKYDTIGAITEKLDGSLLIVSKYKGHYILRTRGTIDAATLANGYELDVFKSNILNNIDHYMKYADTWSTSFLFEWLSINNQIVINYGSDPQFKLIGAIHHDDYTLVSQDVLNTIAKRYGIDRPKIYSNSSYMLDDVKAWKNLEGVVVYSDGGQTLHKVKSDWYLALHRLKSNLASRKKVVDVWISIGMPNYDDFYNYVLSTFDYEIAEKVKGDIKFIIDLKNFYDASIDDIKKFIGEFNTSDTQKDKAAAILSKYKGTGLDSLAFMVLNNKLRDDTCIKFIINKC